MIFFSGDDPDVASDTNAICLNDDVVDKYGHFLCKVKGRYLTVRKMDSGNVKVSLTEIGAMILPVG